MKKTSPEQRPKIYSYVRISTDAQIQGHGIRRQVEAAEKSAEKYALENGLEIDRDLSLKDIGKSAYTGKNISEGHLGGFLKLIDEGKVAKGSILLIEDFDRLSRQPINVSANLMFQIINSGVDIITLNDRERYTSEKFDLNDMLKCAVKMELAYKESQKKSERGQDNWDRKRSAAGSKKLTARCPAWLTLNKATNEFEVDKHKVEIIARIFNDAINGLGADAISRQLNKESIRPFGSANGWHKSSVRKLLLNRSVMGYFQPRKLVNGVRQDVGSEIKNYFPVIISAEIFNAVQAAISTRKKSGGGRKGNSLSNIFSKIAYCGYCGGKIHSINKGRSSGSFLTCDKKRRSLGCNAIPWKYEAFEKSFLTFVEEVGVISIEAMDGSHDALEIELLNIKNEANNLENKRKKEYLRLDASDHSEEFIMQIIDEYSQKIKRLRGREKELESDLMARRHEMISFNQSRLNVLSELLKLQNSDDGNLFKLRVKIANEIASLISVIFIYSGQDQSKYRTKSYPDMRRENEDKSVYIENSRLISKMILTEQQYKKYVYLGRSSRRRSDRSYVVCYKNSTYRFVGPDSIDLYKGERFIREI